jgi:hypothetical protein
LAFPGIRLTLSPVDKIYSRLEAYRRPAERVHGRGLGTLPAGPKDAGRIITFGTGSRRQGHGSCGRLSPMTLRGRILVLDVVPEACEGTVPLGYRFCHLLVPGCAIGKATAIFSRAEF